MDYKEITELIKMVNKLDLTEFKLKEGDFELVIRTDKYAKFNRTENVIVSSAPVPSYAVPTSAPAPAPVAVPAPDLAAPAASGSSPSAGKGLIEIKSPMVGTFYRSSSPDKPPYVKVGDKIAKGSVVCIVEAMKLFNEIESEISGTIVQVMVEDSSPVEYDQVLFLVEPA
jgi:acetyl-CoA carboxylase biotin carboxyl carrier protein